jgi:hypothetical protein
VVDSGGGTEWLTAGIDDSEAVVLGALSGLGQRGGRSELGKRPRASGRFESKMQNDFE